MHRRGHLFCFSNITILLEKDNYGAAMGEMVNLDDLVDADEVATLLGLSSRNAISVYRSRYDDFPKPVVDRGTGKCRFWLRPDVEAWRASRVR
jgi:predicted DNA-binding transcriptional regulator AlpA